MRSAATRVRRRPRRRLASPPAWNSAAARGVLSSDVHLSNALETTVRKSLLLPVLAAASLAAGCGATAYGSSAHTPATHAPAAHAAAARGANVKITNFAFKPGTIHVK